MGKLSIRESSSEQFHVVQMCSQQAYIQLLVYGEVKVLHLLIVPYVDEELQFSCDHMVFFHLLCRDEV